MHLDFFIIIHIKLCLIWDHREVDIGQDIVIIVQMEVISIYL